MDNLEQSHVGYWLILTYTGDKPSGKGNPIKLYQIQKDKNDRLDVDEVNEAVDLATNEESENLGPEDDVDESDDAAAADEVRTAPAKSTPKAAAPSAARQAEVRNRIFGRKSA
jgi:hypothetical protein